MKSLLKIIGGTLLGIFGGLLLAAIIKLVFTDVSVSDVLYDFTSKKMIVGGVGFALLAIIFFLLSLSIVTIAHEAGHLICGLLSGYKFVSFRIFNFTFIKIDGKIRVKNFSIAGTLGQCLLSPPDLPEEKIPMKFYFAGGVLVNLLLLIIALPLFFIGFNNTLIVLLIIFCVTDLFILITNGIPMKFNGLGNDGYDILHLRNNPLIKRVILVQLRTNAMLQKGVRPKDMPDEWYEWNADIDYKNSLEVSGPFMYASRLIDKMEWEDAYLKHEELYSHKKEIMTLFANEMACELVFLALVTDKKERALELLDDKLRKIIDSCSKIMSSKMRILCAVELYINDDEKKAREIYKSLSLNKGRYLLQGEVESDLAIMLKILNDYKKA